MQFQRLQLENFGPIASVDLNFASPNVTLIVGENSSGKTQLAGALLVALLGSDATSVAKVEPRSNLRTRIRLTIHDGATEDVVQCGVAHTVRPDSPSLITHHVRTSGDHSGRPPLRRLIETIANPDLPNVFLDLERPMEPAAAASLQDWIVQESGLPRDTALLVKDLLPLLESVVAQAELRSHRVVANMLAEWARRLRFDAPVPLVLDQPFGLVDAATKERLVALLRTIARTSQVILLSTSGIIKPDDFDDGCEVFNLSTIPRTSELTQLAMSSLHLRAALQNFEARQQESYANELLLRIEERTRRLERVSHAIQRTQDTSFSELSTGQRRIEQGLARVGDLVLQLTAKADSLADNYSETLEEALARRDASFADKVCSDITATLSRMLRQEVPRDQLVPYFRRLRDELGSAWQRFTPVTQRDLALSQYLRDNEALGCMHLAVLELCRAVEHEIGRELFAPFQAVASEAGPWQSEPDGLPKRFFRSYEQLFRFVNADTRLSLGQFPWILLAARKQPQIPLFTALRSYLKTRYGDGAEEIARDVEALGLSHMAGPLAHHCTTLAELRNRCAHPPSLAGDDEDLITVDTFSLIWSHLLREPVRLLSRVVAAREIDEPDMGE